MAHIDESMLDISWTTIVLEICSVGLHGTSIESFIHILIRPLDFGVSKRLERVSALHVELVEVFQWDVWSISRFDHVIWWVRKVVWVVIEVVGLE